MNNAELIDAARRLATSPCLDCGWDEENRPCKPDDDMIIALADALEAVEQRIAELEARLPKEGEWRDDNGAVVPLDDYGYTTDLCQCSVCGDWLIASDEYHVRGRYCPNCGARMKGEQE